MGSEENIELVKRAFAAMGDGDPQALRTLFAEDFAWTIPGDWALAGTHHGHVGLTDLLRKASRSVQTKIANPVEFVAQRDRVLMVGSATGTINATNETFEDCFVFAVTVRDGKIASIREYIDTLALARASHLAACPQPPSAHTDSTPSVER